MKNRVFIYGTLLNEETRKKVIGREVKVFTDTITGYYLSKMKSKDGTDYPDIVEGAGNVTGGVIEVDDNELVKIDLYEGKEYTRKLIMTKSGISAFVYDA